MTGRGTIRVPRPISLSGRVMRSIFRALKPYVGRMTVGFIIKVAGTIAELMIPWALSVMVDDVIPRRSTRDVLLWGVVMILFAFAALVCNILANRMASLVARNTTERVRLQLYSRISFLSLRQQDAYTLPSLISRATSDTYNIHQFLGMMQRLGVRQPIMLIGGLAVTFTMDAHLSLVMVSLLPFMILFVWLFCTKGVPMYRKVQDALDRFIRLVREDTAGIRVIKALSKTPEEKRKFEKINHEVVDKDFRAGLVMGGMRPVVSIILNTGIVLVIYFGAVRVNGGQTKPGVVMAFLSYVTIILNSILFLSRLFISYSRASASADRIEEVLNTPEDLLIEQKERRDFSAHIVFDQVSFGYEESDCVRDISFDVPHGTTLGIIGATGSGKTTIVNLLMRYYDPQAGAVFIDGLDVRAYPSAQLMTKFGAVFQNDVIFHDTIRENIRFGRNISDEEIMKAVKCAQADDFVSEYGLDYMCAIRGMNLSGGQKQRILIARALAGRPEILIFDDASSALDYATDARLRAAIRQNYGKITTIIVAQRISTIMYADRILVLDEGRIIGDGTHRELMQTCSVYREISDTQMGRGEIDA